MKFELEDYALTEFELYMLENECHIQDNGEIIVSERYRLKKPPKAKVCDMVLQWYTNEQYGLQRISRMSMTGEPLTGGQWYRREIRPGHFTLAIKQRHKQLTEYWKEWGNLWVDMEIIGWQLRPNARVYTLDEQMKWVPQHGMPTCKVAWDVGDALGVEELVGPSRVVNWTVCDVKGPAS